ncbi:MAG: hypothetical protein K2X97_14935 [Mycobacteriaceae bacterium]|nr:hypothetical protein [Mycobacteriaceae bacterium]
MSVDERELVGSISLTDFAALCDLQGHEDVPYPFAHSAPLLQDEGSDAGTRPVAERFSNGDLRIFAAWIEAYRRADIWVRCRVHYRCGPDTRLLALRADESGFLASQRSGQDVVDVYSLSAYDLGPAIASSVVLTKPGRRSRIVIPSCVNYFVDADVDYDDDRVVSVRAPVAGPTGVRVRDAEVAALATVQSHHLPARSWGVNWEEKFLVWVRVDDDGDYIYDAAFSHAEPMSERKLGERIDGLIGEDVAALRRRRGIG